MSRVECGMSRVECGMSRVEGLRHVTSGGVAACREWRDCGMSRVEGLRHVASGEVAEMSLVGLEPASAKGGCNAAAQSQPGGCGSG